MYGTNAFDAYHLKSTTGKKSGVINEHEARRLNHIDYINELDHVKNVYCARFKWNLSELNVSDEYIEKCLFTSGLVAFYKSPTLGNIILPARVGKFNIYGEPGELILTPMNGEVITVPYSVNSSEVVLFKDNPSGSIPFIIYDRYATIIADLMRTCDVYSKGLKKPWIAVGDFDDKKTIEQINSNIQNNEYLVVIDRKFFKNKEGELETPELKQSEHNATDLRGIFMHKQSLLAEMYAKLGIETSIIHKSAQVTEDEINKNDAAVKIILAQAYECRQASLKKMNEIAGTNIQCEVMLDLSEDDPLNLAEE